MCNLARLVPLWGRESVGPLGAALHDHAAPRGVVAKYDVQPTRLKPGLLKDVLATHLRGSALPVDPQDPYAGRLGGGEGVHGPEPVDRAEVVAVHRTLRTG